MKLQAIRAGDVVRYVCLPGIVPRLRRFAVDGFGSLALLMAFLFASVRLLPPGHPYLNPANRGRFGIRHAIAEAANHLVLKKENIDQVVIFLTIVTGFVILVAQFVLLALAVTIKPVFAGVAPSFTDFFITPLPERDIAYMLLDSVFGIPDLYESCIETGASCGDASPPPPPFPTPFHIGLHALLNFYNLAILILGVLVFLYYVLIAVGETATTGTPFGKRFNSIWAPIRLVVAIGLLVPINYGLNSAQYIALYAAKFGSSFATNGWYLFNTALTDGLTLGPGPISPGGATGGAIGWNPAQYRSPGAGNVAGTHSNAHLIAQPSAPHTDHIMQFMMLARACAVGYESLYSNENMQIEAYRVRAPSLSNVVAPGQWLSTVQFYDYRDIRIVFGHKSESRYPTQPGYVYPYCGEITLHTNDVSDVGGSAQALPGAREAQEAWFDWVLNMWANLQFENFGIRANCLHLLNKASIAAVAGGCPGGGFGGNDVATRMPPDEWKQQMASDQHVIIENDMYGAYVTMLNSTNVAVTDDIVERGWGGAGIWYNQIARWNGALFSAAKRPPTVSRMPSTMQKVQEERRAANQNDVAQDRYEPNLKEGPEINFGNPPNQIYIASMLNEVYKYWRLSNTTSVAEMQPSGNIFTDLMNGIFGLDGLFDLRYNDSVHPMAQLSAIGKSIVDSSIGSLVVAVAFAAGGGATEMVDKHLGGAADAISKMFVSFATIGIAIGFVLYYILPMLPFIYFFLSVGAWVKTIFEAMVGVPLWALAHLKIDGDGLPGDMALNGYFLIFEIFIRPILTVFGLIGGMAVFAAMVRTMNGIFPLVVQNLTGFDCVGCTPTTNIYGLYEFKRAIIDEFFFTIVYAILVYLTALSSFKMIDAVPNHILSWMGANVKSFGDQRDDPTDNLIGYAAYGGQQVAGDAIGALTTGARTVGNVAGAPLGLLAGRLGGGGAPKIFGRGP